MLRLMLRVIRNRKEIENINNTVNEIEKELAKVKQMINK